uniref:Carboxymuconolactone decarboxylase-like domain-containing protein n=1 Tax=Aquisalinus luteolus TaxID=1566827 RepID=A0A8J3A6D3_9PROT|nr:hypothetical protein GCM10011355_09360 [Aquisalinus luteolus]
MPIAAFTAAGDIEKLEAAITEALDAGVPVYDIREVLIQMYAYAGFPRSLNALTALADILETREASGIEDRLGEDATPLPEDTDMNALGNDVRNQITGRDMTTNSAKYAQIAPVIDVYLKEHLFGDIFSRDVLTHQERELATISALAAMSGVEAQLRGHYRVSLTTGLTPEQLYHFTDILRDRVDPQTAAKAQRILEEVLQARTEQGASNE